MTARIYTDTEVEELIARGVDRGMRDFFTSIGVDLSSIDARNELRKDLEYTRAWRNAIVSAQSTSIKTAVTVIVTGLIGVLGVFLFGHHS